MSSNSAVSMNSVTLGGVVYIVAIKRISLRLLCDRMVISQSCDIMKNTALCE